MLKKCVVLCNGNKIRMNLTPTAQWVLETCNLINPKCMTWWLSNTLSITGTIEKCTLMSYYAVTNGNFLPTFRDNLWSLRTYHYSLRDSPEESSSRLRKKPVTTVYRYFVLRCLISVSTNSDCCVGQESAFRVATIGMKVYGSRRFCRKPLKRIKEEIRRRRRRKKSRSVEEALTWISSCSEEV